MKLRLLYFGIVREKLGRAGEVRECDEGISVGDLLEQLAETHGIFALGAGVLRVAVNREYVDASQVLADNDEVAVIPPVAGGRTEGAVSHPTAADEGARELPWRRRTTRSPRCF